MDVQTNILSKFRFYLREYIAVYSILFFIASIWISYPLWIGISSSVPHIHWIDSLAVFDEYAIANSLLLLLSLLLVGYGIWKPANNNILFMGIVLFCFYLNLDINRFHPLSYFYLCLWILAYLSRKYASDMLSSILFLLASVYIWSGIHKLHPHFYTECYQWLMGVLPITKPLVHSRTNALILPLIELLGGIFLLSNTWRKIGVLILTAMHLFIISIMIYSQWNYLILSWNCFMIVVLGVLYFEDSTFVTYFYNCKKIPLIFLRFICLIFPALYCIDQIDPTLSFTMYSGRNSYADIYLTASDNTVYRSKLNDVNGFYTIDINEFGYHEYRSPTILPNMPLKKMFQIMTNTYSDSTMLVLTKFSMFDDTATYEVLYK